MAHPNTKIADMMDIYKCSQEEAIIRLDMYDTGFQRGRKEGQAEAQRFFRLALGVEEPDYDERALWNNPVPLMETE